MDSKLKSHKEAVQKKFDELNKTKEQLTGQIKQAQQRLNEINVEQIRLQGRFQEIQELDQPETDRGEEKLEDSKKS